ncbi:putative ATP-dependent RNA helicase DHX30 [Copidosoma floridanum]|uniref:putative ATP-dependent RNA helicase DHX30 n=1 Tax=Copidosoma floridanum TaxID=29053 RepID=UPI000C6F6FE6|nr:putative ATP-dependent RNA helicase DHX30 [Copidosoma floridanum]
MPSNIGICGCSITVSLIKKTLESNLMYRSVIIMGTRSFYTSSMTSCQTSVNEANISDTSYQLVNERKINGPNLASEMKQKNLHLLKNEDLKSKIFNASLDVLKWMFSETHVLPDKVIEKKFPSAKVCLHNVYTIVANETKILNPMIVSTKHVNQKKKMVWSSTYSVKWPEEKSFTSIASSKAVASESAALKCLYWLHLTKKVQNRLPIIYEKQEKLSMMKTPDELKIDENILATLNQFLDQHEHEIQNALTVVAKKSATHFQDSRLKLLKMHPVSFVSVENDMRNSILAERLRSRIKVSSLDLPIFRYKSEILRELEENQALVIKGDTGCGKTTQVPQFIIDNMTEKGIGSNCNMVVTQPRRISAISLAERVAFERYEHIGDVIGYQVRLQQVLPKQNGSILFCTTGILLKKIQNNPNLEGCSHVIVDEAHERSVDTDMLLVLLKRALKKNLKLRVIVMSATINADLFQKYLDCRAVEVPGRIFPVKTYLMDDMYELDIPFHKPLDIIEDHAEPNVNCDQITDLIRWIDNAKPPGAILCFLPGWSHIYRIQITLDRYESHRFEVIPLHSKIPYLNQSKIFQPTPQGKRKIILATDVAETGITVPDIVYVIDSACHKEVRWHKNKGLSSIDTHWISRANFNQRRGRAGRVREGESYHFITKQKFSDLDAYPLPEVLRVSLEKTVLDCKTYSSEKVEDFLGSMPQPPRQSYVKKAVQDLQILGALDENEDLTALGKRIALFTVHPKLSKALVYSSIFQCLSPVATVVAALSTQSEIFYDTLENKSHIRETKARFHPTSDHLAVSWIHAQWQNFFNQSRQNAYNFCRINRLHAERISILDKVQDVSLKFVMA